MSNETDKRTATQRIEDLEKVVTTLYQGIVEIMNTTKSLTDLRSDTVLMKDALQLLNKKADAIIQAAAPETGITADSVTALVVKMNVESLKEQVKGYLTNGQLEVADTVSENSFLVGEEYSQEGTLVNPRIQFRLSTLDEATKSALNGKKAGDTVSFGENKFSIKILEVYSLVEPKAPTEVAAAPEAAAAETPTPEVTAPAEVASPAPEATPAAPALAELPTETPVTTFVDSDLSTALTANS